MERNRHIGDPAWIISRTEKNGIIAPRITQTYIDEIGENEQVGTVKTCYSDEVLYFNLDSAIEAYMRMEYDIAAELRTKIQKIESNFSKRAEIEKEAAASINDGLTDNSLTAMLFLGKDAKHADINNIPEVKFQPGQIVFAVLTPETHNMMSRSRKDYRVIKVKIKNVKVWTVNRTTPEIIYDVDSSYRIKSEDFFATEEEAKKARTKAIKEQILMLKEKIEDYELEELMSIKEQYKEIIEEYDKKKRK